MDFDLAANTKVADINAVPSHLRALYAQSDDGFVVGDNMKELASTVSGLQAALAKELKLKTSANNEAANSRVALKAYNEIGSLLGIEGDVTPDSLKDAVSRLTSEVKGGKELKVNLDKIRADSEKRIAEITGAKDQEVSGMRKTLERYLVENAAIAEIAAAKGEPELALPHIRDRVRVFQDGSEYVVRVVDAQGDPRSDGKGGWMTVKDLVQEMKRHPVFGRVFESDGIAGSGAAPGAASVPASSRAGVVQPKTARDKIASGLRKTR